MEDSCKMNACCSCTANIITRYIVECILIVGYHGLDEWRAIHYIYITEVLLKVQVRSISLALYVAGPVCVQQYFLKYSFGILIGESAQTKGYQ